MAVMVVFHLCIFIYASTKIIVKNSITINTTKLLNYGAYKPGAWEYLFDKGMCSPNVSQYFVFFKHDYQRHSEHKTT